MASIHISPSFLKPHALAGTLTPSGRDLLPPDFTLCWKSLHPAQGTLGSCSHQLPGFSPLRPSHSSVAKSCLTFCPSREEQPLSVEQPSSFSAWVAWQAGISSIPPTASLACCLLSRKSGLWKLCSLCTIASPAYLPPSQDFTQFLLFCFFLLVGGNIVVKNIPDFASNSPVYGL